MGRRKQRSASSACEDVAGSPVASARHSSYYSAFSGDDEPVTYLAAESTSSMLARRPTFYGVRERIPTRIDILRHPSSEWWSDARVDAPHVAEDLGSEPRVLSHTFKVRVLDREEKCGNELEYFSDCAKTKPLRDSRRYLILQLLCGQKLIVSIAECFDVDEFDSLFSAGGDGLKLIVNPANVKIPWSITGPKESSTIQEFFGETNCSIKSKRENGVSFTVITIDVFSKFMIRSFLPKLAFQPGRVSDYLIVDYGRRMIVTGYRLVCTETLIELWRSHNKRVSLSSLPPPR